MRLLLASAAVLLAPGLAAQPALHSTSCTLHDHGDMAASGPILDVFGAPLAADPTTATRVETLGSATFQVDYSGFTPQAQAAFQRAVDIWADHLVSSVPIRVQASFASLGSTTLGSAGPNVTANTPNIPRTSTWYPFALADARAGRDLSPDEGDFFYDIVAQFSSSRTDWYFGLDGNPGPSQFDFVTIVLHELGHGLGFVGSGTVDDGTGERECTGTAGLGCWGLGSADFPLVFDRLVDDAAGVPMLNALRYPDPSRALGDLLRSQALFVDSPEVVRLYGEPAPVWAPVAFEEGSSFSHWDEIVVQGTSAALMTPRIGRGEAYQDPGDITCAYFRDIGWTLGAGCETLTVDDEAGPGASALAVSVVGPNPFRQATAVRVTQARPGPVRVTVVDVLGREVARLWDGVAGTEHALDVRPEGWASGVYRVVAESEGGVRTVALTHVR
ncbi:hypothetical protein [Rubrivirga sp.]|uniref:hypothetical protein n=1 Tax=Rubrivirga sp. TaxID=1885344 RepID=UPI003B51F3D9